EPLREKGRRVRLSGISLFLRRLVSIKLLRGDAECRVGRYVRGHAHLSADHQAAARRRLPLRALFSSLASSRIPTRTSPPLPIPAPQREQVTRLSFVACLGLRICCCHTSGT